MPVLHIHIVDDLYEDLKNRVKEQGLTVAGHSSAMGKIKEALFEMAVVDALDDKGLLETIIDMVKEEQE